MKFVCFLFCILFLITSCANMQPPTGGPGDLTPPIFAASILNNTLNFNDKDITLTFNKYMNRQSVNENMMILPTTKFTYKWSGKKLILYFDSLQANTTYSIQMGTNVKDYYNVESNSIDAIVFSTGSIIDTGKIVGKFWPDININTTNSNDYVLFVYNFSEDSINYSEQKVNYKAVINQEGQFQVPALKDGKYRIFAVKDTDKDDVINILKDSVVFATADAVVKNGISDSMKLISYRTEQIDTTDTTKTDIITTDTIQKIDTTIKDTTEFPPVYQKFSGSIALDFQCDSKYILIFNATNKITYQVIINSDNTFIFPEILAGEYKIMLYCDINSNDEYDTGNLTPFSFAEPFIISSKTLIIKEHWDIVDYIINE